MPQSFCWFCHAAAPLLCEGTVKALAKLCGYACWPEPLLFPYVRSIFFTRAGSYVLTFSWVGIFVLLFLELPIMLSHLEYTHVQAISWEDFVHASKSLTNWVKPGFMLSLWVICQSLHVNKIHKNNNSFLIIPTLSSRSYFCRWTSF